MGREPVFKVGDKVTYKYKEHLPDGQYCYGGNCQGGFVGIVREVHSFQSKRQCFSIEVSTKNGHSFTMLESEFVEYDTKPDSASDILKLGDKVTFKVGDKTYNYVVRSSYLELIQSGNNDKIFDALKLDKYSFASRHYGYSSDCGSWPECVSRDFPALTRLVNALYEEIARQKSSSIEEFDKETFTIKGKTEIWKFRRKICFIELENGHTEKRFQECFDDFNIVGNYYEILKSLLKGVSGSGTCPEYSSKYYKETFLYLSLYEGS